MRSLLVFLQRLASTQSVVHSCNVALLHIDERDKCIASSVIHSGGRNIVVVVGLAHLAGVAEQLVSVGGYEEVQQEGEEQEEEEEEESHW